MDYGEGCRKLFAFWGNYNASKMSASFDYTKINLYDILGIAVDASEKDVSIGYECVVWTL